ncbi:stomatin-like protein 3 isoform X3 [Motacilla alba alba]|uniref:stomatin-like protein 3 isoform X3 n=1 Tax=Motacilla alba alba TaxID=1094192 RepID=UPI0018D552A5|nr:stomatin-like protein 3 isoform X3 [Motacilla alba alba]
MDPQTERPKKINTEHLIADRQEGIGVCGWILVSLSFLLVLITFPISIWACIKVVREYERAVVFRLGRILSKKAKGPGMILVLPCTDTFIKVDLRMVTCKIPPQEILTRDAVTAQVDGVVHYRIHSAVSAVANVTDVHSATLLLAQTALRNVLGTRSLAQLLAGREEIARSIQVHHVAFPLPALCSSWCVVCPQGYPRQCHGAVGCQSGPCGDQRHPDPRGHAEGNGS